MLHLLQGVYVHGIPADVLVSGGPFHRLGAQTQQETGPKVDSMGNMCHIKVATPLDFRCMVINGHPRYSYLKPLCAFLFLQVCG